MSARHENCRCDSNTTCRHCLARGDERNAADYAYYPLAWYNNALDNNSRHPASDESEPNKP